MKSKLLTVTALLALTTFSSQAVAFPTSGVKLRDKAKTKTSVFYSRPHNVAIPTNLNIETACFITCYPSQSNCLISTATPILTTYRPAHASRSYVWSNTARFQAYENNINTGAVESPISTMLHAIAFYEGTRTGTSSRWMIADNAAVAATAIAGLASGTSPYNNAVTEFGEMMTDFIGNHGSVLWQICPMIINQGEQDSFLGTTEADYVDNANGLRDVRSDFLVSLNALRGTSFNPPAIFTQIANSSHGSVGANDRLMHSTIPVFQAHLGRDRPTEFIGPLPTHNIPFQGNQHYSNVGAQRYGALVARYYVSYLDNPGDSSAWLRPLRPDSNSFSCNANEITFDVIGGSGTTSLVADTASVAPKWMYGFSVTCPSQIDNAGPDDESNPIVTSVAINTPSARQIRLTLDKNCTSDCIVEYGTRHVPRSQPGPTGQGAPGGNIRNNRTDRMYGQPIRDWDWMISFEEGLDTCTNCTQSTVTALQFQNSLRTDNSPLGGVSVGNWTTSNGTQHASFCEKIRNASWPASNTAVVWAHEASSRTQMSLRGGSGGGQLRWLLAANTNDTGTSFNSPNASFASNTTYVVCGSYDGTQTDGGDAGSDANDERVNFWRCTNACVCTELTATGTFSGTIPSSLTTVVTDLNISGQSEGGNSLGGEWQHEHMLWWGNYSITSLEVAAYCDALFVSQPPTLGGIFGQNADIYLPLQGNLENIGTLPNVAIGYGPGLVWQGSSF